MGTHVIITNFGDDGYFASGGAGHSASTSRCGGGCGGGSYSTSYISGNGGSGIVLVRYPIGYS